MSRLWKLLAQRKLTEAQKYLNALDFPEQHYAAAEIACLQHQTEQALKHLHAVSPQFDVQHWQEMMNLGAEQSALLWSNSLSRADADLLLPLLQYHAENRLQQKRYPLASQLFARAIKWAQALNQPCDTLYRDLALCAHSLGQHDKQQYFFQQAARYAPHPLLYELQRLQALPFVYVSESQLEESRLHLEQALPEFIAETEAALKRGETLPLSMKPFFLLAYQGKNNRDIMRQIGDFWHRLLPRQAPPIHRPGQHKKLHIGFISRFFYHHSVLICYLPTIHKMAQRPDIEIHCFHLGEKYDDQTELLAAGVQHFHHIQGEHAAATVISQQLDVLIYTDIGMDTLTYRLALERLAPIQVVLAGHPDTTGLPNIDYYIANRLAEPPDAESHYSEVLAPVSTGFSPLRAPVVTKESKRTELGFAAHGTIYFCPMTLFKIHPKEDRFIADILRQDPSGRVYFVKDRHAPYANQLKQRFQNTYPDIAKRIHFLPWMPLARFVQTLHAADVILDSHYFGAGTTARLVLGLKLPLLTLPGPFARGRFSYGCYRALGLESLCAKSESDFVAKALEWGHSPELRQHLGEQIGNAHPRMDELCLESEQQLVTFLQKALTEWPKLVKPTGLPVL